MASLSNNTLLRYCHFIALYFAQGIPEGMLAFGIPAWMAINGKTPGQIASFAIAVGLPWSFKFIVAPLMDRYTYLPMGRKRPWVIVGQLGLILSCIYLAYVPDPLNNLNQMMLAGFLVSFFGAFQDVATDGMAVDIIPLNQQARANGFMWGSKTIGMSVSLALGSWLISKYNYTSAILALAAIIGLIMLMPLFTTERENEKLAPWTIGKASNETKTLQLDNWLTIFKSLFQVFTLRNSLMIAIILFISQGAFKYISTLLPIFTVKELGWTNVTYSQYYATAKLIGGITGMLLGGILIEWFGKKRMLNIYFIGLIILTSSFVFFKTYWANMYFIYSFMIVYNIIYTITSICLFAIAMQCCWEKVSASQFTLYMTIANLGQIALAAFIGPIKAQFDWQITIWAFAIMIAVVWVLLQFLKINKQIAKVAELERKDLDSNLFKMAAD
ncbi:MAG TPA: MFS transporter [Chitinophagaceae bacterium]|nr:MFS transporter [Chitinophagaceae bacterium]